MTSNPTAARLKEEGNALFVKKDYALAIAKYSEAIAVDGENAVLYANRAACHLGLQQYLDATDDSEKATKLDPLYSKAWARLASARDGLKEPTRSVEAWQRALDTLPKENLTPGELKQREQYTAGLGAAKARLAKGEAPELIVFKSAKGKMPWDLAQQVQSKLDLSTMDGRRSSVWVILEAYDDFSEGVQVMNQLKKVQTPLGEAYGGMTMSIEGITNGIMRDSRVFHIEDPNWVSKYNNQMSFEAAKSQAWVDGGPEKVISESQKRLRTRGWGDVRPALAITIRAWIMRGFLEGGMRKNYVAREEFFRRALDVIEWGRSAWKNVSRTERGAIFDETFLRGLRAMHMDALMEILADGRNSSPKYTLEDLYEKANDMIRAGVPPLSSIGGGVGPGFISSFMVYPEGTAYAMLGFYFQQMAKASPPGSDAFIEHLRNAAGAYLHAADRFPEDDEQFVLYLSCALTHMFACGTTVRETTTIMERLRNAVPQMLKIWSHSVMAKGGRDERVAEIARMEKEILEMVEQGKLTMEDRVSIEMVSGQR